ncbi:gephyrin-like molybdotransferase Glp [Hyphococcus sp.]|uniref:molybdopterin molybdotransferase MoeA n=1 Tax=Hyphococcus sp. TaxID=2038636 RepID=UPI003CCB96D7
MLSVDEAVTAILRGAAPLEAEAMPLAKLTGRIAAEDVIAQLTQPPFAASAMDGYAVRFADVKTGVSLKVIGEAPAGAPFKGEIRTGEAVRIFTGGVIPDGADHVIIQEKVTRDGERITVTETADAPRHIRPAGIDFKKGDRLAQAGERLHEIHGAIFAAGNISEARVIGRPTVALFSNGDELIEPGGDLRPGEIVNSNHYALSAMVERWGGAPEYLGRAADNEDAIREFFARARNADIIVPIGGASVGDYDFVKTAFAKEGGDIVFEKVAVRPGKPTWHGRLGSARIIGLPGNPASAIVTAALFVQPLARRLAGHAATEGSVFEKAALSRPLKANSAREAYLRAEVSPLVYGYNAVPADDQDSSLLFPFARSNALIRRLANAPAAKEGDEVEILWLRQAA